MTNATVGIVYQQIIKDVIETSRVDFEEGGVDESVLEELAEGWQKKLSSLGVAQFPWDPKPEPTPAPAISNPPPIASNYHQRDTPPLSQPQSNFSLPQLPPMQPMQDANTVRVKTEPMENGLTLPSYNGGSGMTAQQRAAQNLQATYGSRAAASINAIQTNSPHHAQQQQQHQQGPQQRPSGQQMQRPPVSQAQYQQQLAEQTARQKQQAQMGNAQTDGAGELDDCVGILKRFDDQGQEVEMGRIEIDHMIRQKIEAMGQRMEGGGLMLPLSARKPAGSSKKRKVAQVGSTGPSQLDGGDEDDDDKSGILKEEHFDEDAINSDLDDPDDGLNEDEDDDEAMGHIMLCMYDKVQRVKNKWKCVMKDGVLTVNGREYVFHKASGEYEW